MIEDISANNKQEIPQLYTKNEIMRQNNIKDDICQVNDAIRNFTMILMELKIPYKCFKDMKGAWAFDKYGSELISDIIINRTLEKYLHLRQGKRLKHRHGDYIWIIHKAIKNLYSVREYARIKGEKNIEKYYPHPITVFCDFWRDMYKKSQQDIFFLPWLTCLSKYKDEIKEVRELWLEDDALYIGIPMLNEIRFMSEVYSKESDYRRAEKNFNEKWASILKKIIAFRIHELVSMCYIWMHYQNDIKKVYKELQMPIARRPATLSSERKLYSKRIKIEEESLKKAKKLVKYIARKRNYYRFVPKKVDSLTLCALAEVNQIKKCLWRKTKRKSVVKALKINKSRTCVIRAKKPKIAI